MKQLINITKVDKRIVLMIHRKAVTSLILTKKEFAQLKKEVNNFRED